MAGDAIDDFMERYRREYDFFDKAARLAAQTLEAHLGAAGIRCIVSSRAKAWSRLEAKIRQRAQQRQRDRANAYTSAEDIRCDIIDLAGVRVALYFPGDRHRVDDIVRQLFSLRTEPRLFPASSTAKYNKRFSGYSAVHYRANLKRSSLNEAEQRYAEAIIEIQVASVLMHSWAEVEHDLVYKAQQGSLSAEEYAILDQLNGMVLSGEIALELLQRAGQIRIAAGERHFSNHYDLASHLISTVTRSTGAPLQDAALGRVDLLYQFLHHLQLATPNQLAPYIASVTANFEKRPLAEQIIDQLLNDPARYELYENLRATGPLPTDHQRASNIVGQQEGGADSAFLTAWIELEQKIHTRASAVPAERIYPSSRLLSRLGISDERLLKDFDRIRRLRNEVVHGVSPPSAADLTDAVNTIRQISARLDRLRH
ncbi:MAG: hypothetical protein JO340_17565 [Acidobacteriaceae bacterium]|nr:hypothetical protein [Acidobacteriaceae bacterium]